jgi:HD-GYP domain-containing protein (c-di-GMP phosphodiesterase class II)
MEKFNSESNSIIISMSIGVATSLSDEEDIYSIFQRADDSMYQYKLSQSGSLKSKVIDILITALSERDYITQGHVERLTKMAELMGERVGLSDVERRNLVLLAKVHDLGKIGIPDEILHKPGRLTNEEYEKMKQHSAIGYNIASRSKELSHIAVLILHHHEFWNGKGYPDGIKGEEIPIECRILSILDAYDAMTSRRPYHEGLNHKAAVLELKRCSGSQFDPFLVDRFIEYFDKPENAS